MQSIHYIADGKNDWIMEKSMEVLYESAVLFKAGIQIEKGMKSAKLKLMQPVFDDFKTEMDKVVPKFGLELENKFNYYFYEDTKHHEKFYDSANSTYPGLNYVIKKLNSKNQIFRGGFG